jgi:hypothetical protein
MAHAETRRWRWHAAVVAGLALCPMGTAARAASSVSEARASDSNLAAWRAFQLKDFARCERLAHEAWRLAEAESAPLQSAFAAANLGAAIAMRGRLDEALEWSGRALERLGPGRQPVVRGRILVARAILQKLRGEDEASARAFEDARRALGAEDWRLAFADALAQAYDWNDFGVAYERLAALRDAARGGAGSKHAALALLALGWIQGIGSGFDGVKSFVDARAAMVAAGETAILPLVDHNLGTVYLKVGWLDEGQAVYERGLGAARAANDRRMEVILLDDLSQLFSQREDWARAQAADREAGERLAAIAEDVRRGRLEDSLLLDLRRLFKMRYTHQP